MRNLKRALSLAMASIMILGMMVIGAGAVSYDEFSDKDKIVNKEAVNTMVSLGVINGKTDGSYDPTGVVTRAEMAKLIAVMLTGGKDPTLGNLTSNFTDTKGNWADSYIAYCANLGIINGRGDGTFGPNEAVNGTAAAKMLLTALGYRSDIEKLTGAAWEINTNVLANKIDLFNGIESILPQEGLSRDNTAQMVYNAVQANEVEYKNNYGEYSGVIYAQPNGTVLENRFKVIKVEGVVEANDVFSLDKNPAAKGKIRLTDTNTYTDRSGGVQNYNAAYGVAVPNDMVGKRIVIYVKFQNNLAPNAASSTVIGTPILSSKNVIVETNGKLKDDTKVKDALKGSGISVANQVGLSSDANYFAGTTEILVTETGTSKGANGATGATAGIQTAPGVKQTFIDHNNDGKVDYVIQVKAGLSKVTAYNTKDAKLTLSGIKSIDFVDIANEEDVAKDDYVLVAKYDDTYYLTKATTVTGKVTAYDSSNDKITIDGTAYAMGAGKNLAADLDSNPLATDLSAMVDGSFTVYQDAFGNILAYTEGDAAVGNYAVITAATKDGAAGFQSGKVKLLMADGTSGTYTVNLLASAKKWTDTVNSGTNSTKEDNMANALTPSLVGTVVSYTLDGSNVTIGLPNEVNAKYHLSTGGNLDTSKELLQSSRSSYNITGGTNAKQIMADSGTAFFIQDGNGDFTAVSGLNNLNSTGIITTKFEAVSYNAKSDNSGTYVAKAVFAKTNAVYSTNKNFAYIIDTFTKTTEGNNDIYTYPVVLEDGTMTTLKSKTEDGIKSGYAYSYSLNNGGYAELTLLAGRTINDVVVTDSGRGTVAVTSASNTGINPTSYPVPSKAQVWNVVDADVKDSGSVYSTSMSVNDKVAIVVNAEGNVTAAFVHGALNGEMTKELSTAGVAKTGSGTLAAPALDKKGGTSTFTGVAANDTLALTVNFDSTNQTATYAITQNSALKGNTALTTKTGTASSGVSIPFYTADGGVENGGKVTITITLKPIAGKADDGKVNRVITFEYTVTSAAVTADAATVTASVAGASSTLTPTVDTHDYTWGTALAGVQKGDTLSMKFASITGTAKVVKVEADGGLKTSGVKVAVGKEFANTIPVTLYQVAEKDKTEQGTLKVTVEFAQAGKTPVQVVYNFAITHDQNLYTLTITGTSNDKYYKNESITMSTIPNVGEFYTKDGTNFVPKATPFVMPGGADVTLDIGYYEVAAGAASYTIDGIAFGLSVNTPVYAKTGDKVKVTVTVPVGAATAGDVPATITASGGETVDGGVAVGTPSNVVLGTDKLTTPTGAGTATTAGSYTFDITIDGADITVTIA